MKIIGALSSLAVTVFLIPSLGLPVAFILGVLSGGIVGFILKSMPKGNPVPDNQVDTTEAAEQRAIAQVRRQLAEVKKIAVPTEASYLADIVSGIEAGDAMAHWNLGESYLNGRVFLSDPFPKNKKAALFWFRRSAELGLASSQYNLGVTYLGDAAWQLSLLYSEEYAIEKNLTEAVRWLGLAASQSDAFAAFAQDVLGEMYFLGIGVNEDHARAFDFFTRSLANPENISVKMGTPTRAWERLPALRAEGYA